jgi:hypothetical protein
VPPKAAYKRFDANPDVEFEFYLADKLSRTVAELRESVSNEEFVEWSVYYGRKAQRQELAAKMARHERR